MTEQMIDAEVNFDKLHQKQIITQQRKTMIRVPWEKPVGSGTIDGRARG